MNDLILTSFRNKNSFIFYSDLFFLFYNGHIEKSKKYYNFSIVMAYDHMENIKKYLNLQDYKINKNMRFNQSRFYLEGKDDIYFVLNYNIVNKSKFLGLNNNGKRRIEQEIDKSIKLAFYIENKDL